jgi:hypothetical protein
MSKHIANNHRLSRRQIALTIAKAVTVIDLVGSIDTIALISLLTGTAIMLLCILLFLSVQNFETQKF